MLKGEVLSCFGASGWLVQSKGFSFEPAQLAYALDVSAWLEGAVDAPLALIEGETGTGKTLGYLIPLLLQLANTGARGVLATHTINLQNQMLDGGDVDVALEYLASLNKPILQIQQLIGRQEYIDPLRTESALLSLRDEGLPAHIVSDLVAAAYRCAGRDGLIESFLFDAGPLPEGMSNADICLSADSENDVNIGFEAQRKKAMFADLVITSHMMLLLNRYYDRSAIFETEDRKLSYVIIDEADLLSSAAENLSSHKLHVKQFLNPIKEIYSQLTAKEKAIVADLQENNNLAFELIQRIDKVNQRSATIMIHELGAHYETQLREIFKPLHDKSVQLTNLLQKRVESLPSSAAQAIQDFQKHTNIIESVLGAAREGDATGISWSPTKRIPSIEVGRAYPAKRICNYFIHEDSVCRVMFTSATLTNGASGSFVNFKTTIQSYSESKYCVQSINAPQTFGSVDYVLTSPNVPKPIVRDDDQSLLNDRWLTHAVSLIQAAAEAGPTLVLCISFKEAAVLSSKLKLQNVWRHQRGQDLNEQIAFFQTHGGVLITPSAWEGISIRGPDGKQLITQLVVTRVPYVPPSPFMDKVYQSFFLKSGMSLSKAQSLTIVRKLASVVRELRQGFGRLIRHKLDVGTIWIADPRFPTYLGASLNKSDGSLTAAIPTRFKTSYHTAQVFMSDESTLAPAPIKQHLPQELTQWL